MSNGLNIPVKHPKFPSLHEEQAWLESQRLHAQVEMKEIGHKLSVPGHMHEKETLLGKHLKLKRAVIEIETQLLQTKAKLKAQKAESANNRENDPIPLIVDLTGIALQVLAELQDINRKLPEPKAE